MWHHLNLSQILGYTNDGMLSSLYWNSLFIYRPINNESEWEFWIKTPFKNENFTENLQNRQYKIKEIIIKIEKTFASKNIKYHISQ